ncbi:MAG: hypothetical protein L6V95_01715 [Candidatus Melainabacteria bacterium]|nr:MAG: hypothetical protein L6V95_01715 [Candidatus Melainabacteria bacterium]
MYKKLTNLLFIQAAILLVSASVAYADGMPLEPIGADSTYNLPSIKKCFFKQFKCNQIR